MTTILPMSRDCIIYWVNAWLAPVECVFDMIEPELVRRGTALERADNLQAGLTVPTC